MKENEDLKKLGQEVGGKILRIVASDKVKEADTANWALCRNLVESAGFLNAMQRIVNGKQ